MATTYTNWQEMAKAISKVVAKAWLDEGFKNLLMQDAKNILEKEGISFPTGTHVKVDQRVFSWKIEPIDPTSEVAAITIPLPPKPAGVSDQELTDWVAGASSQYPCCLPNSC